MNFWNRFVNKSGMYRIIQLCEKWYCVKSNEALQNAGYAIKQGDKYDCKNSL